MSFDTRLRAELDDLADEGVVTKDFAGTAWKRGRRRRVRRQAVKATVGVLAVAAFGSGYALVANAHRAQSTLPRVTATQPSPVGTAPAPSVAAVPSVHSTGPIAVGGGWVVGGGPSGDGTWVFDRSTGRYIDLHHTYAYPAPVGPYVAVEDDGLTASDQRIGILNLANGQTRWLATGRTFLSLDWNADGTQIAYRSLTASGKTAVFVADATTGHDQMLPTLPDTGSTGPAWLPGRDEFAIGPDNQGPQALTQVYDAATGQATGTSIVFDTLNNWSPDGRYVVRTSDCSIVEAASGSAVATLRTDCYGSRVYWAGNESVIMLRYGSKADNAWVRYDLNGHEVAVVPMPKEFAVDEKSTYTLVKK
jgi:hypothetical protein